MAGTSDRRSNTTKTKNTKQTAAPSINGPGAGVNFDSSGAQISQQLLEISAKLAKLDELERLNKDLLKTVLQLSNRVDRVTEENRRLKQEVSDLKQAQIQREVLIRGVKLENPQQHQEILRKVCDFAGFNCDQAVEEVHPLVFKKNEKTDGVLVKFWNTSAKAKFLKCVRSLKKPLSPRDLNIRSRNKFIFIQDHLTQEKQKIHSDTRELVKYGLERPWLYKGSTWINHPETKKRFRVRDSTDIEELEFILVTRQTTEPKEVPEAVN